MINVLFFPISIPENWPANLSWADTLHTLEAVNLFPFYFLSFSDRPFSLRWVMVDFGLNFLLTIPFGIGLGYLKKPRFLKMCLWALLVGLSLDGIQLVVKLATGTFYHAVDINDVILNSLGVLFGYFLYWICLKLTVKMRKSQNP